MRAILASVAGLILIGASTPAEPPRSPEAQAKLDKWLGGRIAGERRTCLPVGKTNDPIGIDDYTVLFRDGPRIWRNDLRAGSGCEKLGKQYMMVTSSLAGRLCNGNSVAIVENHEPDVAVGACELGDFVLYQKP